MNKARLQNLKRILRSRRSRVNILGTAIRPRLSVFRSNKYTYAQLIDDNNGHTLVSAFTKKGDYKGPKAEQAKVLGERLGEAAKKTGIKSAVFDRGNYKYHGRVKAVAEGARSAGLKF